MSEPKPGSAEANEAGCTCPTIDNHYGRGYGGDGAKYGWVTDGRCPLHCDAAIENAEKERT